MVFIYIVQLLKILYVCYQVDRTNLEVKKTEAVGGFDVASILARRIAVEMSDSESGEDDDTDDDEEWD